MIRALGVVSPQIVRGHATRFRLLVGRWSGDARDHDAERQHDVHRDLHGKHRRTHRRVFRQHRLHVAASHPHRSGDQLRLRHRRSCGQGSASIPSRCAGPEPSRRSSLRPTRSITTSDDGIRVSFNGTLLINNFTDHAPTENSGVTPVLVAGQAYPIQIDFYENAGGAVARLSWSSASQPKQIVPQSRLHLERRSRFRSGSTSSRPRPPSRPAIRGRRLVFGARSGRRRLRLEHQPHRRDARTQRTGRSTARHALPLPRRVESGRSPCRTARYDVRASIGDPSFASTHTLIVEGATYWPATALGANQFLNTSASVLVGDGRLTLSQGGAADKATRVNFVEISRP